MSRTIRRTKIRGRYPRFEADYLYHQPSTWKGVMLNSWNRAALPRLPLKGQAYDRAWHQFHSDKGMRGFAFENAFERPMKTPTYRQRYKARCEVRKWLANPEYEVIVQRDPQIWDYC